MMDWAETGAVPVTFGKCHRCFVGIKPPPKAHFHHAMNRFFLCVAVQSTQFGDKAEKALDRHVRIGRGVFRQITDETFGGNRVVDDVVSADGDEARLGGSRMKPVIMRMVVDFPAPLGPRKPSTSAAFNRERNAIDGHFWAEGIYSVYQL